MATPTLLDAAKALLNTWDAAMPMDEYEVAITKAEADLRAAVAVAETPPVCSRCGEPDRMGGHPECADATRLEEAMKRVTEVEERLTEARKVTPEMMAKPYSVSYRPPCPECHGASVLYGYCSYCGCSGRDPG